MPFGTEAPSRRHEIDRPEGQSSRLRRLLVFKGLSPMLFGCLGISSVIGVGHSAWFGQYFLTLAYAAALAYSVLRCIHWMRVDLSALTAQEREHKEQRIRRAVFVLSPLMALSSVLLVTQSPTGTDYMVAGWMTMLALVAGISLCAFPNLARGTMITLLLPSNATLLIQGELSALLFGATMIGLSLLAMCAFDTVLRLVRSLSEEADENALMHGWIAGAMQDFLNMSRNAAWEMDTRHCFTQLSASALDLTGRDPADFIGAPVTSMMDLDDRQSRASRRAFQKHFDARTPFKDMIVAIAHPEGRRYVAVAGSPIYSHAGEFAGYRGLLSDITSRIEAQRAMADSEVRFRDFAELAAERLWETDEDHRFTYISANPNGDDDVDYSQFIGKKGGEAFARFNQDTEEERQAWAEHWDAIARREPYRNFVVRNGRGGVYSLSAKPRFDAEGNFLGYRGYSRNITAEYTAREAERRAEQALAEANRQLEERIGERTGELEEKTNLMQEIFDTMGESLVVLDENLKIAMVNEKRSISLPPGKWEIGGDARAIYVRAHALGLYPERPGLYGARSSITELLDRGEALRLNRIDTSGQHISEHFYPRKGGGYVVLYTDITREARREEELRALSIDLRRSKEEAETASRTKSEFLANMSHEIRTPMNGILGMSELLMDTELSDKQREMTRTVTRSAESLLTIINDILDFSKLEAGKMTFAREGFDLRSALGDVVDILAPKAASKDIHLNLDYDPSISDRFVGDVGRIRQVITNLVGNGVKFTDEGSVDVTVRKRAAGASVRLDIEVMDSGCGIPADKLDRIFNKFEQVDGSSSRRFEGTGLGLSISKLIAENMGGTITVVSKEGIGSTFTFSVTLPVDQAQSVAATSTNDPAERAAQACANGITILLAEDNVVNQMVLKAMLEPLDAEIFVAQNGAEAVELFGQHDFDFILMDVSMPVMDGHEATREIKKIQARTGRTVPVIGITAHAMREDHERCLAAGMDDYLPKPVRKEAVMEKIAVMMEQKGARTKSGAA